MPVRIVHGCGALERLGGIGALLGKRPFLVTGKSSARKSGALDAVLAQLPDTVVYEGIEENPTDADCDEAAQACRDAGCDWVVALGGGSPMDAAKAVAGLAKHEGLCRGYFGKGAFKNGALPIVAIPTTAGTGSEVTPYAVLVDHEKRTKRTIGGDCLFAHTAILDPELTRTMPRGVTLSTGLDALAQAMEGMVSKKATALGNVLALDTVRLVRAWLPKVLEDGGDLEARGAMLYAAMLSGCIIAQSGTTLVHGMGYYYTLECGVGHGLANALLLPPLFRFNAHELPAEVAAIAQALGQPCEAKPKSAAEAIVAGLHALYAACGLSPKASDAGVEAPKLRHFASDVSADPYRFRNQPGEIDKETVLRFYQEAQQGA